MNQRVLGGTSALKWGNQGFGGIEVLRYWLFLGMGCFSDVGCFGKRVILPVYGIIDFRVGSGFGLFC
jgi:hypothetical protein